MNFNDLSKKYIAIRCIYKSEAEEFVNLAYKYGYYWEYGDIKTKNFTNFGVYRSTCYYIQRGRLCYGDDSWLIQDGRRIINFDTFMEKFNDIVTEENCYIEYRRKGNMTIATLRDDMGRYIKHAKAICSPEDKYDFEVGKKIALRRLLGTGDENNGVKNL